MIIYLCGLSSAHATRALHTKSNKKVNCSITSEQRRGVERKRNQRSVVLVMLTDILLIVFPGPRGVGGSRGIEGVILWAVTNTIPVKEADGRTDAGTR